MSALQHWQDLIKEKKKQNSFRDFLLEIPSRYPLVLYKNSWLTSLYPENKRSCPVLSQKEFEISIPNLVSAWLDYDIEWEFFEQVQTLFLQTPFSALYNYSGAENSDFSFSVLQSKNCYLSFTVITDCENIVYSFAVKEWCRNVFASSQVSNVSENIRESSCVIKGYNIFYSRFILNSSEIRWSTNLIWCHECLLCNGLEHKTYCIQNEQLTKDQYFEKKYEILQEKHTFENKYRELNPVWDNRGSTNTMNSNFVLNSHDVENGMYSFNLKTAKNTLVVWSPHPNEYIYDSFEAWSLGNSHFYGVINTWVRSEHIYNSEGIVTCYNIFYSRFLENCNHCLWCIGLRNQEFCILNKQYERDARFEIVNKVFSRMDDAWDIGDYFPGWLCPYYFNDTIASLVWNFTKEEVEAAWYLRRDEEIAVDIPDWMEVVEVHELWQYDGWKDSDGKFYPTAQIPTPEAPLPLDREQHQIDFHDISIQSF